MTEFLSIMTPSTLASMAADISLYLVEEHDGEYDAGLALSAADWDAVQADAKPIIAALEALVGGETIDRLMAAGADPTHIL